MHTIFTFTPNKVILDKVTIIPFLFRMATSSDCQLEERYLRLHSLVMSSTRVLQAKFDALFPPDQLKKWSPKDKDLKNAKLSAYQIKHVKANRDSSKFDISLLVSLLRNFCYTNDKKHSLWDELDNDKIVPSLQFEIAQIVRIRNLRNKVCNFVLLFNRSTLISELDPYLSMIFQTCLLHIKYIKTLKTQSWFLNMFLCYFFADESCSSSGNE